MATVLVPTAHTYAPANLDTLEELAIQVKRKLDIIEQSMRRLFKNANLALFKQSIDLKLK